MVGHWGSSADSYLADPTSPIPSHCASIVTTSTVRVIASKTKLMVFRRNVSKVDVVFQGRVASKVNNEAHVGNIISTDIYNDEMSILKKKSEKFLEQNFGGNKKVIFRPNFYSLVILTIFLKV